MTYPGVMALDRSSYSQQEVHGALRRRGNASLTVHNDRQTCAKLLVDLDAQPHMIMRILRHADQAVTMEICANASSAATPEALRRLGEILDRALLYLPIRRRSSASVYIAD